MAPKVQTTSVKNAENGLLWERWSAFWAKQCRTWCLVCTQTSEHTRQPLHRQVNPVMHTSTPRHAPELGYPRAGHRASLRMRAPSCRSSGQPADESAQLQVIGPACGAAGARTATATATNRSNFACNSPINLSYIEIPSLQFQRFRAPQGTSSGELHATFGGCHP